MENEVNIHTITDRDMICFGILKCQGQFHGSAKRGYYVWVTSKNPEVCEYLRTTWGGKVSHRGNGYFTWMLVGRDKIVNLWTVYRQWANKNQKGWVPEEWKEAEEKEIAKLYDQT